MAHAPETQAAVALSAVHLCPQEPQLSGSLTNPLFRYSQPVANWRSQSLCEASQLEIMHVPALHIGMLLGAVVGVESSMPTNSDRAA